MNTLLPLIKTTDGKPPRITATKRVPRIPVELVLRRIRDFFKTLPALFWVSHVIERKKQQRPVSLEDFKVWLDEKIGRAFRQIRKEDKSLKLA